MNTFESIKQQDADLWLDLERNRAAIEREPTEFRAKILKLLLQIATVAERTTALDDYSWLQTAATRWRMTASSVLGVPLPQSLHVPAPQSLYAPRSERVWSKANLDDWLTNKAWEIFRRRAISRYYDKSEEQILAGASSSPEEYASDGYTARIYLACDVLDGKLDFVRDFDAGSYPLLEGDCWLKEVKRTKAYLRWRTRDGSWGEESAVRDYCDACKEIRDRSVDSAGKASHSSFESVNQYLQKKYVRRTDSGTWELQSKAIKDLIAIKAHRIWELTGCANAAENWKKAETFVRSFYRNVIPAVTEEDRKAISEVVNLLQLGDDTNRLDLANCFEAAIAVYFLNAAKLNTLLSSHLETGDVNTTGLAVQKAVA